MGRWTLRLLTLGALSCVLTACASAKPAVQTRAERHRLESLQAELDRNRELWVREGLTDYDLTLQRICFCPEELTQPVIIGVRDSRIASVRVVRTGRPVDPDDRDVYPDVEGLFWIVQEAIDSDAASVDAAFDDTRGFPSHVDIDYEREAYDEEMLYTVLELTPADASPGS